MTNNLRRSAQELIERLGHGATAYMQDRIAKIRAQGDSPELDQAYRLLTEIEAILDEER